MSEEGKGDMANTMTEAEKERGAVVAWLRKLANSPAPTGYSPFLPVVTGILLDASFAIERLDHHKSEGREG